MQRIKLKCTRKNAIGVTVEPRYNEVLIGTMKITLLYQVSHYIRVKKLEIQWNLIIKRSDITKPSYKKVILLVPILYISLFFYPDMRNLI